MSETIADFDVVIIGAGPAGLSLAGSLAAQGLAIALVERLPEASLAAPEFDGREIALPYSEPQPNPNVYLGSRNALSIFQTPTIARVGWVGGLTKPPRA